jgi:hypothetical protein
MARENHKRKAAIIALWLQGGSYLKVAKAFGISRQRVHQIISPPPETKEALRIRAKDKCEQCGCPLAFGAHIHHKERPPDKYNDLSNLEYICYACHAKEHGRFGGGCTESEFLETYGHLFGPYGDPRAREYSEEITK